MGMQKVEWFAQSHLDAILISNTFVQFYALLLIGNYILLWDQYPPLWNIICPLWANTFWDVSRQAYGPELDHGRTGLA